ncbi:hypothetical protein DFH07DRAFT_824482 [Mycena maculata]|uniref:Uncharacterized protein n=1 Tax=Mycena maculata TaxID=230809 RepID=A0AAD7IYH4_9AGAR|nr:hypothetical protein DFH07DRAFT_824482 [Mycena maculata]
MSSVTCLALVPPQDVRCTNPVPNVAAGHLWCPRCHRAERKHYDSYKHYSNTLDTYDNTKICTDLEAITNCDLSETLGSWAKYLRKKLTLYGRVIRGREYHHGRFHAGGDSSHLYYLGVLYDERSETDAALLAVNLRHDEISGITSSDLEDAHQEEVAEILGWKDSAASEVVVGEDPYADRFEEDRGRERDLLIERFFAFRTTAMLHGIDTADQFIDYMERLLILAISERSGMRALLHPGASDVETFLAQDIVTLEELKQIYVAVHLMPPQRVLSAINDAFRSQQDEHDVVLGRRIYKHQSDGKICFAAWDLFEDVMPCRHCALQGSHRLEHWTQIERLATLSLRFWNWEPENVAELSGADMLFHLSGVFGERKWERHYPKPYRNKKLNFWAQTERPAGLYLKVTDFSHRPTGR